MTGAGLAVAAVGGMHGRPGAVLGMGRPAWSACLAALAVTAACTATGNAVAAAAGLTTTSPGLHGPVLTGVLMFLAQAFLLQAIPEEVLFRGYLVQTALGRLPLWGVTALSVLVFTVPHLLSSSGADTLGERLTFLLLPLGFALLAVAFRLRTGSVWPAVAVHGGFHVSWFVAGLLVAPRPDAYGIYLAIVGGVFVLVGLPAVRYAIARGALDDEPARMVGAGPSSESR